MWSNSSITITCNAQNGQFHLEMRPFRKTAEQRRWPFSGAQKQVNVFIFAALRAECTEAARAFGPQRANLNTLLHRAGLFLLGCKQAVGIPNLTSTRFSGRKPSAVCSTQRAAVVADARKPPVTTSLMGCWLRQYGVSVSFDTCYWSIQLCL